MVIELATDVQEVISARHSLYNCLADSNQVKDPAWSDEGFVESEMPIIR